MISELSAYIRNIAVFLILMSFISIITPKKKYGEYINLILAFILIFLVLRPITLAVGAFGQGKADIGALFDDASLKFNSGLLQKEEGFYEETQKRAVLSQYSNELSSQLKRIVENAGFEYCAGEFELDGGAENFGAILSVSLTVSEAEPAPTKKPFIRVEPVKVNAGSAKEEPQIVETSHIKELKKTILDFYQILDEHIYIIVQEKN